MTSEHALDGGFSPPESRSAPAAPARWFDSAIAGYMVAVLVVLTLAVTSWSFTQRTGRARAFVSHTHEVLANVAAAEAAFWRAESAQRGFLVSRRADFLAERDAALAVAGRHVDDMARLTADNAGQQQRIAQLRVLLQERIVLYGQTQALAQMERNLDAAQRLKAGLAVMARIQPAFLALAAEEQRLLQLRETQERDHLHATRRIFVSMVLAILLTVPLVFWQLLRQTRARARAEADAATERAYTALHGRMLTLYNSARGAPAALEGTLELLAAQPLFRAAGLYRLTDDAHEWRAVAVRGAPAEVAAVPLPGTGAAAEAARTRQPVLLRSTDAAVSPVLTGWLVSQRVVNVLLCPVTYYEQTLGVLALAAVERLSARENDFVSQLCAQLGIALHNLEQYRQLDELANRLSEQGLELQRKNAALEQAGRSKSEFLANMSHELRTPLNAVIGFAEVMRDGLVGDLNPEQAEYVDEIAASGKHLLSLINEVLDLAKVEAGQMALELEPLSAAELAASGMSMLRERAQQQRVRLCCEVAPELGLLYADTRKARQIVFNLLSNAVKFTPAGGQVELRLARVPAPRGAGLQPDAHTRVVPPCHGGPADFLEISVRDSGIGIAPPDLERLFQPFVQIESALNRQYAGTGLGLSLVLRLTELHGGGIQVHSRPQQGSTFTVWLPWRTEAPAATTTPSTP
ncbi:sensor histidine kinase [Azohydromonas australica]|uniref:sensor histidine kinase n=1 Tax=Azohydromonas australica TaxID=364039 RepID=UPI00041378F3|nr:ATP-binding protein [Azohydromonas australica]